MITEIRIYKLKRGKAENFMHVFLNACLPMLHNWKVDVVDFGISLIDNQSFYLIRSYESISERKLSQDAFYGSDEWINGPEKEIWDCIDTYNTTVIDNERLNISKS